MERHNKNVSPIQHQTTPLKKRAPPPLPTLQPPTNSPASFFGHPKYQKRHPPKDVGYGKRENLLGVAESESYSNYHRSPSKFILDGIIANSDVIMAATSSDSLPLDDDASGGGNVDKRSFWIAFSSNEQQEALREVRLIDTFYFLRHKNSRHSFSFCDSISIRHISSPN
jgi:hypothetical protein